MDLGIKDQVAIVTGGGGGIGAETCRILADEGAHVAVVDVRLDNAKEIADQVRSRGVRAAAMEIDITSPEQTQEMVARTISELGRVDILNNLAGLAFPGLFENSKPEQWEKEIHVCLLGVMNSSKAAIKPMMEQKHGKIVNVASDAGKAGEKLMVSYSAAKAGILGLEFLNEELQQRWVKSYALRRLGEPKDTARMVVFLSSNAAEWITGQAISVNGGYFMG
jgi:NAD(P)-dependent dehydrogenase (short-subunit alcohol dehydrogenase family)